MDIYAQIAKMEELIAYVQTELPIFAERVAANDLAALVTLRVTQKGENFKGQPFSPYSVKPVAAYKLWGKSRTQKAEKAVRAISRKRGTLTTKTFRELNGLRTDKKIFEFSGEMFRKFGVVKSTTAAGTFLVVIGGTTTEAQRKIDENSEREGLSIVEASDAEKVIVEAAVLGWLERNAQRILNA